MNVHFSVLPELRGAAPVQRALMEGMAATGVTTIRMDAGMDTGPILLQAEEAILPDDDAGSLGARLAAIGARLLVDTLDRLQAGTIKERIQDGSLATYAPKLTAEDQRLRWERDASVVLRQIRALSPEPGAETMFRGRRLKVYRASGPTDGRTPAVGHGGPGEILRAGRDGLVVAAGGTPILLEEVQPEGRRRMSGAEFARGYRPEPGDLLG